MKNRALPMNLQIFAETGDGGAAGAGAAQQTQQQQTQQQGQAQTAPQIDYDKIAQLVQGKQAATEESVIKGYLKQQGLTKEQMEQVISTFKQQQAANTPDINAIQQQLTQAQAVAQQAQSEAAATMAAIGLGVDAKTIPYLLKMADLSQVMGQDGKINDEALKTALNKVLEDVPALKPQELGKTGFTQIGTAGSSAQQPQQTTATQPQTPAKRWNRWN